MKKICLITVIFRVKQVQSSNTEWMMKRVAVLCGLLVCIFCVTSFAHAVPDRISYQGVLNDGGGSPVSATVSMTFRIYDAETGGNLLWNETQSVQVTNGTFNVKLGEVAPLTSSVFEADSRYLSLQVEADPEMTPRQQITTGAYAYKAVLVEETIPPIGALMAWMKSMSGTPTLPNGWVECNGQTLSDPDSAYNGQVIPDLNGENRFLRGSTTSGAVGGSESHSHATPFGYASGSFTLWGSPPTSGEITSGAWHNQDGSTSSNYQRIITYSADTRPSFYAVVWIMKVK